MRITFLLLAITFSLNLSAIPCVSLLSRLVKPTPHFKKTVKVKFMCFYGEVHSGLHVLGMKNQLERKGFYDSDFYLDLGPSLDEEKTEGLDEVIMPDVVEMTRRIANQDYVVMVFNTHGVLQKYLKLVDWLGTAQGKNYMIRALESTPDISDKILASDFKHDRVKIPRIYYAGNVTAGHSFADFDHSELINRVIADQKWRKNIR